jgi:hypothetical protein
MVRREARPSRLDNVRSIEYQLMQSIALSNRGYSFPKKEGAKTTAAARGRTGFPQADMDALGALASSHRANGGMAESRGWSLADGIGQDSCRYRRYAGHPAQGRRQFTCEMRFRKSARDRPYPTNDVLSPNYYNGSLPTQRYPHLQSLKRSFPHAEA